MASGRFLSTSIAEDDRLSKLSLMAEFIYLKTIPHLDRDGMIGGKPGLLYSRVCPTREEMFGNLQSLIDEWVKVGLVTRFDSAEGPVLFFPGFLKNNTLPHYDRERASRFPVPPGYERIATGLILEGTEPPVKKQKSRTESNESTANVQDEVLESVLDESQDEVLENDSQEQEEEEDQVEDQSTTNNNNNNAGAQETVLKAWGENIPGDVSPILEKKLRELADDCGAPSVIHGIVAAVEGGDDKRNFKYVAKCARSHAVELRLNPNVNGAGSYHIDLPGVHILQPSEQPITPTALPPPMSHDDPWAVALAELSPTLVGVAASWLVGSQLQESGELAGVPLYRVLVTNAAANVTWLAQQAEPAIRKKLSSLFAKRILVEIVAVEHKELAT